MTSDSDCSSTLGCWDRRFCIRSRKSWRFYQRINCEHNQRRLSQLLLTREGTTWIEVRLRPVQSTHRYGERLVTLESFRNFVRNRFRENTDRSASLNEFNRHGSLHGLFENFGQGMNFLRLITLLGLLRFSIGLSGRIDVCTSG